MSREQRLAHVEKLVTEIHAFLIGGDKLKGGKPGLVDVVEQHATEIYGCDEIGHEGLKPQVKRLLDGYKKWVGIVVGVNGTAGLVFIIVINWPTIKSWFVP